MSYVLYTAKVCHVMERHSMRLRRLDDSQIYTNEAVSDNNISCTPPI